MAECDMGLYLDTARIIDAIDQEITDANERKKEIFADVKEQVSPEDFNALKEAIKLRRKRRADKDACERHDERVWAILKVLEAPEVPPKAETPPAATASPGNGIVEEQAPTRAHLRIAHEPTERTEAPSNGEPSSVAVPQDEATHAGTGSETLADRGADQRGGGEAIAFPPRHTAEIPDLPAFLDRRPRLEAAE